MNPREDRVAAYWLRVVELRTQRDQSCQSCHEHPNYNRGFFTRVTLKSPLGPRYDAGNLGIFCYQCRLRGTPTPGHVPQPTNQLALFQ